MRKRVFCNQRVVFVKMVSLSSNFRHPGGTFFGEESGSSHVDDEPLLGTMPILPHEPPVNQWMAEEMKKFRSIKTTKGILLAKILYICLALAAYLLPVFCEGKECGAEATTLIQYVHGAMWFLLLLVHYYLNHEHQNSLLHGYFNFHLDTQTVRRAPLYINSAANAILVILSKVLDTACPENNSCRMFTKAHYLQILISLEVLIALALLVVYLVKTTRFNKAKAVPDFLRSSSSPHSTSTQHEVGYKPAFNLKSWSMGQCWNEVYHLRSAYAGLLKEKQNLINRLGDSVNRDRGAIN